MAKFPTIQEMAKEVADRAKKDLEVNGLPLEEFLVRVEQVISTVNEMYSKTESPIMKKFCEEILNILNVSNELTTDEIATMESYIAEGMCDL
jgi:hypothetical protein